MDTFDVPIIKKTYDLYKIFHHYRRAISKNDRFTIYERSENLIIDILQSLLEAGFGRTTNKNIVLDKASIKLNVLRVFIRLMRETDSIDMKKYVTLQEMIDDIGRQIGGWMRSNQVR